MRQIACGLDVMVLGEGARLPSTMRAAVAVVLRGSQHGFRFDRHAFSGTSIRQPCVVDSNHADHSPGADRAQCSEDGFDDRQWTISFVEGVSWEAVLPLMGQGKSFAFLFPSIGGSRKVTFTEAAELSDLFGREPFGVLEYGLHGTGLHLGLERWT
jgi:hypothetical protein